MNPLNRFYSHLSQIHTILTYLKTDTQTPILHMRVRAHARTHTHTHTHTPILHMRASSALVTQKLPVSFKPFSPSPLEDQDLPLLRTNSFAQLIPPPPLPPPPPRDSLEVSISKSLPPGRFPWPPTLLPDQLRACSLPPFSTTISHIQVWAYEDMWLFKKISLANQIPLSKPGN